MYINTFESNKNCNNNNYKINSIQNNILTNYNNQNTNYKTSKLNELLRNIKSKNIQCFNGKQLKKDEHKKNKKEKKC